MSSRPLHIAVNTRFLLPGDQLEGIGRFTYETLRRLVALHPDVTFHFLFDRPYDTRYLLGPNVVPHVLFPPARHPFLYVAWFEGVVARWLAKHQPAAFLSPDGFTTLNTRVPRVTVVHDLAFEHFPLDVGLLQRKYYHWFMPRFAKASEQVVAVSEFTKADIVKTYGLSPAKISVAYNAPADLFQPQPEAGQREVRRRFSHGQPYFLFVGALQPRKNLGNLLRAFDLFKTTGGPAAANAQLLIVGRKAWKAGPILTAYQRMRHQTAVHFTGRVVDADLAGLYAAARATVYVPYFEGFGIPIVEGQASGSAVLTSNVSSMPEVAGKGGALLVDPNDVERIAAGLTQLWGDADLRRHLIAKGHENLRRFSWTRSAEVLWEAIEAATRRRA
ncbi:glycosyltransferase family 4 protein [Hymenobacter sp. BT683]|uniref:Glycosyltransferase family 4 protein n=1 Tax=Hymenobacter jeongseonensis TaxID=2791027 RepID=A0ABS0IFP9_9BACT|nr:glycosyltransferase family 1 protein [Hymenobacter jeongseonensis]MBF9237191.1 glycosyltransferase family 4 protein [Hymenobacter jeongseonensis]